MKKVYLEGYELFTSAREVLNINSITFAHGDASQDNIVIYFPEGTEAKSSPDGMLTSYLLPTGEELQLDKTDERGGMLHVYLNVGHSMFTMTLDEYLLNVKQTIGTKEYIDTLTACTMGLIGESGEIVDLIKKYLFHGHVNDIHFKQKLKKEIGDLLWYLVALANTQNVHIQSMFDEAESVGTANITVTIEGKLKESCLQLSKYVGRVAYIIEEGMVPPQKNISTYTFMCRLADVLIAVKDLCRTLELDMNEIMRMNIAKLKKRYPDGFSSESSKNREVE